MKTGETKVIYAVEFTGKHLIIGNRDFTQEEIEDILKAIKDAAEIVEGIKVQWKKVENTKKELMHALTPKSNKTSK